MYASIKKRSEPQPRRINVGRLLPASRTVGLGALIKAVMNALGVPSCSGCRRRARALDRRVHFVGGGIEAAAATDCWRYDGACTGWGTRRCVSGAARQEPDAAIVTHCCGGWFQYPWIEVCPGEDARMGCGFCFW